MMTQKILIQLSSSFLLFACLFIGLKSISWTKDLDKEDRKIELINEFGDFMVKAMETEHGINDSERTALVVDSLLNTLCSANDIDPNTITITIVGDSEVNAFALPGKNMILNKGLIDHANSVHEIAGVMAHELAHITQNHVEKKLIKEIGFTVIASVITNGEGGGATVKELITKVTGLSYDRMIEEEADELAVKYMQNANLSSIALAEFLERISKDQDGSIPAWLGTHPATEDRVVNIIDLSNDYVCSKDSLWLQHEWNEML